MKFNKVVSEASKILDLQSGSPGIRIEVKAMATATFRVQTMGHAGPLKLVTDFAVRGEGDKICYVDRAKDVSEDKFIWVFRDKDKMLLYPKRAYSQYLRTELEIKKGHCDPNSWQPEAVYIQFSSNSGCAFNMAAIFVQEEELA